MRIYRTFKDEGDYFEFNIWVNLGGWCDPYLSYSGGVSKEVIEVLLKKQRNK